MSGSLTLLPGEEICLESPKVALTLTNLRVCHRYTFIVDPQLDSITLESVASVGLRTISWLWMLFVAGGLMLMAILVAQMPYGTGGDAAGGLALLGVVFIILYFATRRRYIIVESHGSFQMLVPSRDLSLDECYFMIHAIQRAKLEFLNKLPQEP